MLTPNTNEARRRDRSTVEGDWFGGSGFTSLDIAHLQAFPNGAYYHALFVCALEWMAEDLLNSEVN